MIGLDEYPYQIDYVNLHPAMIQWLTDTAGYDRWNIMYDRLGFKEEKHKILFLLRWEK